MERVVLLAIPCLTLACSAPDAVDGALSPLSAGRHTSARSTVVTITDLGSFGGARPTAFAVNDAGQVVVRVRLPEGNFHAFRWSERDGAVDIGHLGGGNTGANEINDRGVIVGWSMQNPPPSQRYPIRWTERGGIEPFLGATPGVAFGITEAGDIVGNRRVAGSPVFRAFYWSQQGGATDIGFVPGGESGAFDVNEAGHVVGSGRTQATCCRERAFLWSKRHGIQELGSLGGNSFALSLNDQGTVVGTSELVQATPGVTRGGPGRPGSLPMHAFMWTASGGMTDLGTLGGTHSQAWSVDARNRVFGWSDNADGLRRAFMWTAETGMIDLGTLGGATSSSGGINRHGQVVGWSETADGAQHAVLWQVR